MSIYIPSTEIKKPNIHADTLGFTFIWKGHFLRGVNHEAVELAQSYFNSGFVDEIVQKGLFPKTWISDYYNEQFGLIIEHEMISPVLYASEWNSAMLKDAALLVLDIAAIGLKYGYNMVDCHKKNVMFYNNRPIYVDLGSFVPNKAGCNGWRPYKSFKESYYYILDVWSDGSEQIAKRLMSPCVMMSSKDYYLYKQPIWRCAKKLLSYKIYLSNLYNDVALMGFDSKRMRSRSTDAVKRIINKMRLGESQNLARLKRKIARCTVEVSENRPDSQIEFNCTLPEFETALVVNCESHNFLEQLSAIQGASKIISLIEDDKRSAGEYIHFRDNKANIVDISFSLSVPMFVQGYFPEDRIKSDVVFAPNFTFVNSPLGIHNATVRVRQYMVYSKLRKVVLILQNKCDELVNSLRLNYQVEVSEILAPASKICGGGYLPDYK